MPVLQPPSRRELLLAGLASAFLPRLSFAALPTGAPRMRHYVQLLLSGGMDSVLTTDPKTRSQVERWVDVPFGSSEIASAGSLLLGPHLSSFAPLAPRLAVLNGVLMGSAVHPAGIMHFFSMKTRASNGTPRMSTLLAPLLSAEPLPLITATWLEREFDALYDPAKRERLREAASVLRRLQAKQGGDGRGGAASFLERLQSAPPFEEVPWTDEADLKPLARQLQRLLWLLRADLVTCVELDVGGEDEPWDTHTFNLNRQVAAARAFPLLARFLQELTRLEGPHGKLADVTTVVMGSELGRFPRLNGLDGKDHWPEAPILFFGAGIRSGQAAFGATRRTMEAIPVSAKTGRPAHNGILPTLDDVGTTLLHLAGVPRPDVLGSRGRLLEFLVNA